MGIGPTHGSHWGSPPFEREGGVVLGHLIISPNSDQDDTIILIRGLSKSQIGAL